MKVTWTTPATLEGRIDAEYYGQEFVDAAAQLGRHIPTRPFDQLWTDSNRIYIGIAGFEQVDDPTLYTPYLRPVDISDEGLIDYSSLPYCRREWLDDHEKKGCARPGDLIVEVKGNTRKAAVISKAIPPRCIVSGSSYRIQLSSEYDVHFVQAYLLTDLGQKLKRRLTSNTTISYIDPDSFKQYRIPTPDLIIQRAIGTKVRKVERLHRKAMESKKLAFDLLKSHLQFDELPLSSKAPTWSQIAAKHGRLDPEYYQPQYLQIDLYADALPETVQRVEPLSRLIQDGGYGVLPPSDSYGTGDLPFLRAQDVGEFFVEFRDPVVVPRLYANPKAVARTGDLLLEVKGAIEGAAVCPVQAEGFLVNGSVYRASVSDGIHPFYLVGVLTSPIGRLQKRRAAANSIISYLSSEFLESLLIPRIGEQVEAEIGGLLEHFCSMSYEANLLLAESKQNLEDLIDGKLDEAQLVGDGDNAAVWLESNAITL